MNLINIENLGKSFADKVLFENVNFSIHSGEKIGLIGKNGAGKTTFLKIIAGLEGMDSGEITKSRELLIEYLPQNVNFNEDRTIIEEVFRGESENIRLIREYEKVMSSENIDDEKMTELSIKMDQMDAWDLESEAKAILMELGIEDFNKKIKELSGGQKRRVALASALINPSNLLILDEPTNHLDNTTIEWLEEYLKNKKGGLLMVTHDRYFLDRVTNRILELDNRGLYSYDGNYNYYLEKKLERREMERATERKKMSLYRQELAWMKQGVKARGTRQKARVERFEELENRDLITEDKEVDISVSGKRLGRKILEVKNISKSYGERKLIEDFSYTVLRDDRIGILGDNGSGKTTLMNIMVGKLEADSGEVDMGETVKIGYFSQESQYMDESQRAIDYIKEGGEFVETSDGGTITAVQMMERFLFTGQEQWTPIEKLSGGERRRLYLLRVLMEGPNFLILDEPTNDLDINTLTVLEEYIEEFEGPVIIVSHDRYLLDKLVNKIFYLEDGKVIGMVGNYSSYREKKKLLEEEEIEKTKEAPKEKVDIKRNRQLKFSYNEQREWETIDDDIAELEEKIEEIDLEMKAVATNYVKLEELMELKSEIENKLDSKMERWVYLSELKEKIDRQNS